MVACVRLTSNTLSENQPYAVSPSEIAPKMQTIVASPAQPSPAQPTQTNPNQTKPNQTKPNQTKPKKAPRINNTSCFKLDRRASLMKRSSGLTA